MQGFKLALPIIKCWTFVVTSEVVEEIYSVTLHCRDDTKALRAHYLPTPCASSSYLISSKWWNVYLFLARAHSYSCCRHWGLPQRRSFFSFACEIWLQLHQVNCLLPSSCSSTRDTANAVSGYCSDNEWQLSAVNEKEKWARCMAESLTDLWPDCWINYVFCLTLCECDWYNDWDCCEVNGCTRECSVIWMRWEIQASESRVFQKWDPMCVWIEIMISFYD